MAAFKTDGTFTSAAHDGGPRRVFPFARDLTSYIIEQPCMILLANFSRLALNTAHPTDASAYLVEETDLENLGAGLVRWVRRYATVPAARSEYFTDPFVFPAVFDAVGSLNYRISPLGLRVQHRREYAYYLVGSETYPDVASIPILQKWAPLFSAGTPIEVDFVNPATVPTAEDYLTMVDDGDELVVEDSDVHAWLGNIYERVTTYVVAR